MKSQKSDDKNHLAHAGHTPYNFENQLHSMSGGARPSQKRHEEKAVGKQNYQNPFDG